MLLQIISVIVVLTILALLAVKFLFYAGKNRRTLKIQAVENGGCGCEGCGCGGGK